MKLDHHKRDSRRPRRRRRKRNPGCLEGSPREPFANSETLQPNNNNNNEINGRNTFVRVFSSLYLLFLLHFHFF